jgi:hypothetical protein
MESTMLLMNKVSQFVCLTADIEADIHEEFQKGTDSLA